MRKLQEHRHCTPSAQHPAGDFKNFYVAHKSMVYNTCLRLLGNGEDAEDITQDVFCRAYLSLPQFRAESQISTWLYRITVNRCIDHQRRQKRRKWLSLDVLLSRRTPEAGGAASVPAQDPEADLQARETYRLLSRAIQSLPERQRIALVLHRYEGRSHREIAQIMQCSVGSVESLLHRAKTNLAKKLARRLEDD